MPVTTQTGVPCKIQSGDTIIFEFTNSDYPPSTHSASFLLRKGDTAQTPVAATESGETFTVTLSAAVTAAYAPGSYQWQLRYTETSSGNVETGESGILTVLPNFGANGTPSTAQALLTLCEAQLSTLLAAGSVYTSVSFNGQSYTRETVNQLLVQRDRLKAEVARERAALAQSMGQNDGSIYQTVFR